MPYKPNRVKSDFHEALHLLEEGFPEAFSSGEEAWTPLLPGYRGVEVERAYGGVRQRWLLLESQERARAEEEGLWRRVARAEGEARKALEGVSRGLPYHRLVYLGVREERRRGRVGRPRKGEAPVAVHYRLLARLEVDEGKLERARRGLGRFILV